MNIDFHSEKNRYTYASRGAQPDWASAIRSLISSAGKRVADIGCGGGIYSAAWSDIGTDQITGVDFSEQMVQTAAEKNAARTGITFIQGDAAHTGLPAGSVDIVFERALIHHLKDYGDCFREAHRLLVPGGDYIIQDRTPDDVKVPGSPDHIRGYFFECFPKLLDAELGRRPTHHTVCDVLDQAGFEVLPTITLWETRKHYTSFSELSDDLLNRTGRSILHHLTDAELKKLVKYIGERIGTDHPITEKDRWTLWHARRRAG